jgi:MerR family transcriptional regulator, copper efflux regulator
MTDCEDHSTRPDDDAVWVDDRGETKRPRPDQVLSIANVASMFGVSRLTLRYYERRGLIKRRHRVGRVLVYGWADCDRIAFIIKCRRVGLALAEIASVLKATAADASADAIKSGRAKCLELIDRLDGRRRPLREALAELRHLHSLLATKLGNPVEGA